MLACEEHTMQPSGEAADEIWSLCACSSSSVSAVGEAVKVYDGGW